MINSINDIIDLHSSSGNIEDAYKKIHFDNKVLTLNTFTLRFRKGNTSKEETRKWNITLNNEIRKDRNLQKEVREYNSLFKLFNKLKIKSGYITKREMPDFLLERNGEKIGIEITKIYIGNDWVAEKLNEDIKAYKFRKNEVDGYIEYKKYKSRIKTFNIRGGLVIAPMYDEVSMNEYIIEIKNKLFEKIRKLIDDYDKFDKNIIYAEIVTSKFFDKQEDFKSLNDEIKFYIAHLDGINDSREYELVLSTKDSTTIFSLNDGTYKQI